MATMGMRVVFNYTHTPFMTVSIVTRKPWKLRITITPCSMYLNDPENNKAAKDN